MPISERSIGIKMSTHFGDFLTMFAFESVESVFEHLVLLIGIGGAEVRILLNLFVRILLLIFRLII